MLDGLVHVQVHDKGLHDLKTLVVPCPPYLLIAVTVDPHVTDKILRRLQGKELIAFYVMFYHTRTILVI